jgi:hypothetical protein
MMAAMVRRRIMDPGLSVSHCSAERLGMSQLPLMPIDIDVAFLGRAA